MVSKSVLNQDDQISHHSSIILTASLVPKLPDIIVIIIVVVVLPSQESTICDRHQSRTWVIAEQGVSNLY